ncbi:hypothetical protein V6N13_084921 [Hibiscus sabdariffa]|uniref:Uncharacterized protein n=1 Tax=Hibiscus sabdariffa TaxID=183260 RepID=A0ABR2CZZ7_9ROSI
MSESEVVKRFGPWMVAETRRRHPSLRASSVAAPVSTGLIGSRFTALETIEEESGIVAVAQQIMGEPSIAVLGKSPVRSKVVPIQKEVVKNAAYITSNPDRQLKSKSTKTAGIPNSMEVIPTVVGQSASVVHHSPRVRAGNHSAVKIVEQGVKGKGVEFGSFAKVKGDGPILVELDCNRSEHFRAVNAKEIPDPKDPSRMVDMDFQLSDEDDFLEWYKEDEMADTEGAQQPLAQ